METLKTASLRKIESRMEDMDENSLRYQILQSSKDFKTSWIKLGQALYSVWNDKLYKEWGYQAFEAYTAKEIGIKKQTAMKLLQSYYFLEKEEPLYLQKDYHQTASAKEIPGVEAVNVLRLAKRNKEVDENDYAKLRENVFERGRDADDVKKDLTSLIKKRRELDPEEERIKSNSVIVRRCITTLKTIKRDIEILKILPQELTEDIDKLIQRIEAQI